MDSILDYNEYFDITLATDDDYNKDITNSTEIVKDGLSIWMDINNPRCFTGLSINNNMTKITSLSAWTNASVSNFTIYDVGLTSIDNFRFQNLTGESLTFTSASTKLELYQVSGTGTTNNYNISSAITSNGYTYLSLSGGGGFQGVYKISGYDQFNILPNRTELGWTIEQWIKYSGQSGTNSNFFFYIGTRAENKFWNSNFSGETGLTTTSGISLSPSVSANTFLDVADNVMAFRFSGDSIGVRWLSGSTDCSGTITGVTVQESYSKHGIFDNFSGATDNDWINIGIRWKRDQLIDNCEIKSGKTRYNGTLVFYLNARPVYEIKNFKELIFRSLDVHKTKQQLVPFTIGWGFGSFGLKESTTRLGPDNNDKNLDIETNFNGNLNGGISQFRFYVRPLPVSEIVHNFNVERGRYNRNENFGGRLIKINKGIEK